MVGVVTRCLAVAAVAAATILHGLGQARADVVSFLPWCVRSQCSESISVSLALPKGWEARVGKSPRTVIVVLKGRCLYCGDGPAIEVEAEADPGNRSLAEFADQLQGRWRANIPDGKMTREPDIARAEGRESIQLYRIERRDHGRFERLAVTRETDGRGNTFFISIVLAAESRRELSTGSSAFLAILQRLALV